MRLLLPAPLLLSLVSACATLRTHDIADAFARDSAELVERFPTKADLDPARAANAPHVMLRTAQVARDFLEGRDGTSTTAAYARALLACAQLAQGQAKAARDTLRGLKPRMEEELTRENVVIACAIHATSLCRSIEARAAAVAFLEGRLPGEKFVEDYGSFAGLAIAEPGSPEHRKMVKLAAVALEACAPGVAEPGESARKARANLLRTLGEQVYNDAASLVARLPPPHGPATAEEVWLARVAVKGVTTYRYLIPDMLPDPLSPEQRAWQREQAFPLFKDGREIAGYFLPKAARTEVESTRIGKTPDEILYDRLLSSQLEVLAWIDTR
ncbi:MAG TPA: hypothetical protein VFY93_08430 [Planctomycetota bacterium]|nr:hypothetical protein [Planctomycetota bacterium]